MADPKSPPGEDEPIIPPPPIDVPEVGALHLVFPSGFLTYLPSFQINRHAGRIYVGTERNEPYAHWLPHEHLNSALVMEHQAIVRMLAARAVAALPATTRHAQQLAKHNPVLLALVADVVAAVLAQLSLEGVEAQTEAARLSTGKGLVRSKLAGGKKGRRSKLK